MFQAAASERARRLSLNAPRRRSYRSNHRPTFCSVSLELRTKTKNKTRRKLIYYFFGFLGAFFHGEEFGFDETNEAANLFLVLFYFYFLSRALLLS